MAPVAPSVEATALSSRRSCFSYFQYRPTPSAIVDRSVRRRSSSRRSDPVARAPARRSTARRSRPVRRQGDSASSSSSPVTAPTARIAERRDELAQRVGREDLARVGEDHDVACRPRDAGVERERLAAARHGDDVDEAPIARQDVERVVGRAVGDDDDLPAVGGVVEAQQVVDPRGEPRGLRCAPRSRSTRRTADRRIADLRIADCGSIADRCRRSGSAIRSPRSAIRNAGVGRNRAQQPEQQRIADVDVGDGGDGEPEDQGHVALRHRFLAHARASRSSSPAPARPA